MEILEHQRKVLEVNDRLDHRNAAGRTSGALPATGFCALSMARGELIPFNFTFPRARAKTLRVTL